MRVVKRGLGTSSLQQSALAVEGPGFRRDDMELRLRLCLGKAIIERITGATDGADRVLLAAGIEQFPQAADVDVDGALVDIDVAAPDAVEQLLAAEDAAGVLEEEFEQAVLGRAEIDRPARARH